MKKRGTAWHLEFKRIVHFVALTLLSSCYREVQAFSSVVTKTSQLPPLADDWAVQKSALQQKDCCVVSISSIDSCLQILQQELGENGPADMDLRARIRTSASSTTTYKDCLQVRKNAVASDANGATTIADHDPCAMALTELARGIASLADGSSLEGGDVFVRIVCASNYRAREPPFHTDKAPFRGYVTLQGVGTEYMTRTCSPWEYLKLRTFGEDIDGLHASTSSSNRNNLKQAQEIQFIVMKGDYYYDYYKEDAGSSIIEKAWTRARACVHRSPEGNSSRRVIVSFDLADGDDDREWHETGTKRAWRNGLTQRKSHLVA